MDKDIGTSIAASVLNQPATQSAVTNICEKTNKQKTGNSEELSELKRDRMQPLQ